MVGGDDKSQNGVAKGVSLRGVQLHVSPRCEWRLVLVERPEIA